MALMQGLTMLTVSGATIALMKAFQVAGERFVRVDVRFVTSGLLLPGETRLYMGLCRVNGTTDDHLAYAELDVAAALPEETFGANGTVTVPGTSTIADQHLPVAHAGPHAWPALPALGAQVLTVPTGSTTWRFTKLLSLAAGGFGFWPEDLYDPTTGTTSGAVTRWRLIGKAACPAQPTMVIHRFGSASGPGRGGLRFLESVARVDSFSSWATWRSSPAWASLAELGRQLNPTAEPSTTHGLQTLVAPASWLPTP